MEKITLNINGHNAELADNLSGYEWHQFKSLYLEVCIKNEFDSINQELHTKLICTRFEVDIDLFSNNSTSTNFTKKFIGHYEIIADFQSTMQFNTKTFIVDINKAKIEIR